MSKRILAKGHTASNDSMATGLNLHDLVIGPSGAGKTRGYVTPNILQCNESMLVADTKGNLAKDLGPILREHGYEVISVDFKNMATPSGTTPLTASGRTGGESAPSRISSVSRMCCAQPCPTMTPIGKGRPGST